ncbi:hypothetical protein D9615_006541 [Tricholomella constricta]|uniref:Uncharacterized protein n=1 Tax=Tricholomella constricta TaxID=117010 RepID=A0A8H5HA14_9AGAR|nr:hypothetical protein D9615_006541 [Tricholomella constricta]
MGGLDDPWLFEHASWISACISEQFLMPVAPYTLDGESHVELTIKSLAHYNFEPSTVGLSAPAANVEVASISHDSKPSTAPIPAKDSSAQKKRAKRTFTDLEADDSYLEINPWSTKRPRIQEPASPLVATSPRSVKQSQEISKAKIRETNQLQANYTTNASATSRSQNPITERCPAQKTHLPTLTSLLNLPKKHFKKPRINIFKLLIKSENPPTAPQSMDTSQNRHVEPISSLSINMYPHLSYIRGLPDVNYDCLSSCGRIETSPTTFWNRTREAYSGSGPLHLSMADILRAKRPFIDAKLFTPGGTYRNEKFGVAWR